MTQPPPEARLQPSFPAAAVVTFPALCVPRDFGVYIARDPAQLQLTSANLFWRVHHFDALRIYDADGRAYEVCSAQVSRPRSRLGRSLARFCDLQISVEIQVTPLGPASLAAVVSAVEQGLAVDAESFEELSGRSPDWWRSTLSRCASVREVISALAAK